MHVFNVPEDTGVMALYSKPHLEKSILLVLLPLPRQVWTPVTQNDQFD